MCLLNRNGLILHTKSTPPPTKKKKKRKKQREQQQEENINIGTLVFKATT